MNKILIIAALSLAACGPDMTKDGCLPEDWSCRNRYERPSGENADACINRKLDEMSDADNTAVWSAELLRELHRICVSLYPYGSDRPGNPRAKAASLRAGEGR